MDEGITGKLNGLYNPDIPTYYAFFDESGTTETDFLINVLLLTNNRRKIEKRISSIIREINSLKNEDAKRYSFFEGRLHFTDFLNAGEQNLIKEILSKLNSLNFVMFVNIIDTNFEKKTVGRTDYGILASKLDNFRTFTNLYESELWNENIFLVFDKGFLRKLSIIKRVFYVLKDKQYRNGMEFRNFKFIASPYNSSEFLKEEICNCADFMVFPVEVVNSVDKGLQATDFVVGAFNQHFNGNSEFYEIINLTLTLRSANLSGK